MTPIRVLVVEDFPVLREAVCSALATSPLITVVGSAEDGLAAMTLARSLRPDVVMLDLALAGVGGMRVLTTLRRELPDTRVVILSANEQTQIFLEAIAEGAAGYLSKRSTGPELVGAVLTVHGGGTAISPRLTERLAVEYSRAAGGQPGRLHGLLAPREQEVVRHVANGLTDRQIGERMFISPRTVQNYLGAARDKLQLRTRAELARWASEHGQL